MLRIALTLSLLAAVAAPLAAHAASMDLITITDTGVTDPDFGTIFTFTVLANPTPSSSGADYFILNSVATTDSSPSYSGNDLVYFYDTTYSGGLEDDTLNVLSVSGPALFSGSTSSPTFNVGTSGTLTDSGSFTTGHSYSYTITSVNTASSTPEPSSVMLLGTGLLGLAGAVRRKLFVNA